MKNLHGTAVENRFRFELKWKLAAVFVAQIGILAILAYTFPGRYQSSPVFKNTPPVRQLPNSTGYFRVIKDFTGEGGLSHWDVCADDVSTRNGRVGIFTTYMSRKTYIKGLKLRIQTESQSAPIPAQIPKPADTTGKIKTQLTDGFGEFAGNWLLDMDSSNVFSLLIDGFSFEMFDNDKLSLSVNCKRASITDKKLSLLLEGNVVIITSEGKTLKANKVRWDMNGRSFAAQGPYLLTDAGSTANGRNITLDYKACNLVIPFF